MTEAKALSYTKLQRSDCAFLYNQIYDHKNQPPRTPPLEFGVAVHQLLDGYVQIKMEGQDPDKAALVDKLVPNAMYDRVEEIDDILEKFERRFDFDVDNVVGTEESMAVDKADAEVGFWDKSALYRGYVDISFVNGKQGKVIDYKTNVNIESDSDIEKDKQLIGYAWMLWSKYPFIEFPILTGKYFARYGVTKIVEQSEEKIKNFKRFVLKRKQEIDSWEFHDAKACEYCKYCHLLNNICPLSSEINEMLLVTDEKSAIEAVEKVHVLSRLLSNLKDQLKTYCKDNELKSIGDKVKYGFKETVSSFYPVNDAINTANLFEMDINPLLKVQTTEMNKALKKMDKETKIAFESIKQFKQSTKFQQLKD